MLASSATKHGLFDIFVFDNLIVVTLVNYLTAFKSNISMSVPIDILSYIKHLNILLTIFKSCLLISAYMVSG